MFVKVTIVHLLFSPQQLSEWRANPSSQPLASMYVKFFGQEIAFANIDKAVVDQIIQVQHLLLPLLHTQ